MLKKSLLAAAAAVAITGTANAASILDENFENGFGAFSPNGNVAVANGAAYAGCCGTDPANTNNFVAFGGDNQASGSIMSASFATVLGQVYSLTFDFTALGNGSETLFANVGSQAFAVNPVANANLVFQTATFAFTGTGAPTMLSFTSSGINNVDALVDNVVVAAVPEPATWTMMILGFGAVGYGMRKRKIAFNGLQTA